MSGSPVLRNCYIVRGTRRSLGSSLVLSVLVRRKGTTSKEMHDAPLRTTYGVGTIT